MEIKERKEAKQKELQSIIDKANETNAWLAKLQTKAIELQGQIKLLEEMEKPPKKENSK